jgi:undecaprenyl-diphosphatase
MEELIQFDKQLLLAVNGSDSLFLDGMVMALTKAATWIPLYLAMFYVVLRNNKVWQLIVLILACAGLCTLFAGSLDDLLVKPTVARWRPTHDPEIGMLVDVVNEYRGGNYGFFSAHASNTFSIAVFFSLLFRHRIVTCFLVAYSFINCWTRLYLGVHYPGDILVGLLWGATVGVCVWMLFKHLSKRWAAPSTSTTLQEQTTITGYRVKDFYAIYVVFALTLVYAAIRGWLF